MRQKSIKWCSIICLCLVLSGLQAQNTMFINEKSGAQTSLAFTNIDKLTFTAGSMTVNKKDGSTGVYALNNIRYLNFGYTTGIHGVLDLRNNELLLFPNPVKDQLHIQYKSETTGDVQFQIMNVQGKIIYQQTHRSLYGTNDIYIHVAGFDFGVYFCRLMNATKIETTKFIKY